MARDGTFSGGRKKGVSLNKTTIEERDRAGRLLNFLDQYVESDIKELTPHQRMQLYTDLMEYKAPKLQRTILSGDPENPLVKVSDFSRVPTQILTELARHLIEI